MSSVVPSKKAVDVHDKAPDFDLPDINMKSHRLSQYLGKKIILAFFPAAESPVCTAEMCTFRDSLSELRSYGAEIITTKEKQSVNMALL